MTSMINKGLTMLVVISSILLLLSMVAVYLALTGYMG